MIRRYASAFCAFIYYFCILLRVMWTHSLSCTFNACFVILVTHILSAEGDIFFESACWYYLHICVIIYTRTKGEVGAIKNVQCLQWFYCHFKCDVSFVDPFCSFCFTFVFIMLSCWEMADYFALLCIMFPCWVFHFPIWCLWWGMVLYWFLIFAFFFTFRGCFSWSSQPLMSF